MAYSNSMHRQYGTTLRRLDRRQNNAGMARTYWGSTGFTLRIQRHCIVIYFYHRYLRYNPYLKKYRANVIEKNDTIILLPEAELNLRQLVSSIHPATIPYYYGDLIEGDPEILIMLNNDTILIDKDFSRSVIPSELNQLYKYLAFATFELDLPEDLP